MIGETIFYYKQKALLGILVIGIALLIYFSDSASPSIKSYSQVSSMEGSSFMPQTETVTSYNDSLLKVPLIVSETAIVGIVFNHIFFQRVIRNHFQLSHEEDNIYAGLLMETKSIRPLRRLFIVLLSCGIAIFVSATSLFLLQVLSLSSELGTDINTTLPILSTTPVGLVWNIRVVTSLIIIASSILYYLCEKWSSPKARRDLESGSSVCSSSPKDKTSRKIGILSSILLYIVLFAGAITIFSNSMVSHNTALSFYPTIAVSTDWFHFMAVSVWLGGLFYISVVLIMRIRISIGTNYRTEGSKNKVADMSTIYGVAYFLAILLPHFSLIATVSLGIIGVTGLYMAWIHLHTAEAIFTSSYGNILAIKLLLILPMIVLGGYHQIKLHSSLMTVSKLRKEIQRKRGKEIDTRFMTQHSDRNDMSTTQRQSDPSVKFSKTIKIESLIGVGVLIAASFLTITSPPSISAQNSLSTQSSQQESRQDDSPLLDSFTILAIILSVAVICGSIFYFRKSKMQLRDTVDYLKNINK